MSSSTTTVRPLALNWTTDSTWVRAAMVVTGAVVVAATAQWEIPLWPVPISAQSLSVLLVGATLGARLGGMSMLTYLAMGSVGLPVFAGGGAGVQHLFGPTVGYLVGFVVAAALMGWMAQRFRTTRSIVASGATAAATFLFATVVILAFGAAGLMVVLDYSVAQAWTAGVTPFWIGALIKAGAATLYIPTAWWATDRLSDPRSGKPFAESWQRAVDGIHRVARGVRSSFMRD